MSRVFDSNTTHYTDWYISRGNQYQAEADPAHHQRIKVNMPLSLEVLSASIDVPKELQQTPPEYVLLVESGANVHILWNQCLLAHVAERNSIIS